MSILVAGRTGAGGSLVQIVNLNEVIKALKKLGLNANDLGTATTRVRNLVLPPVISLTPVKTGRLLRTVKANKFPNKVIVQAGNNTTVTYALPIHWGWKRRNIESNPFMEKVRDRYANRVENIFVEELQKILRKAGYL